MSGSVDHSAAPRSRRAGHSRLAADTLWVASSTAAGRLTALGSSVILARALSPRDMGAYWIALSVLSSAAVLAELGLGQTAVRDVASAMSTADVERARRTVRDIVFWGVCGVVAATLLVAGVGAGLRLPAQLLVAACLWMGVETLRSLLTELLRGFKDIRSACLYGGVLPGTASLGLLAAAWWIWPGQIGLTAALALAASGQAIALTLAAWRVRNALPHEATSPPSQPVSIQVLRQSWPVLLNTAVWISLGQVDIWILTVFRPPAEVALYGIATRLAALLIVPQNIAKAAISPRIAELHARRDSAALERLLRGAATAAGGLALLGFVVVVALGESFLGALYGPWYRRALGPFVLLGLGQVVAAATGISATALMMTGKQRVVVSASSLRFVLVAVAAVWLAPLYGILGVAATVGAGTALQNLWMLARVRRSLGVWTHFTLPSRQRLGLR